MGRTWRDLHILGKNLKYSCCLWNKAKNLDEAELEMLESYLDNKRSTARKYQDWGNHHGMNFVKEPKDTRSNYWLNVAVTEDQKQRDYMIELTNKNNKMTRPVWTPMHKLAINNDCQKNSMKNTEWLFDRLVYVPSSVVMDE